MNTNTKKKKCILISLVILVFMVIAIPLSIHLIDVNKYKMTNEELEQYFQSIELLDEKLNNIIQDGISFSHEYYNEYVNTEYGRKIYREQIISNYDSYKCLLDIKFPKKYSELFAQFIYSSAVEYISCELAALTFQDSVDEFKDYFPPGALTLYNQKLHDQLYDKYYIPKDYSNLNFEQILYKIKSEYIDGDTSASKMYDELHEIFYNEDFLKQLK